MSGTSRRRSADDKAGQSQGGGKEIPPPRAGLQQGTSGHGQPLPFCSAGMPTPQAY